MRADAELESKTAEARTEPRRNCGHSILWPKFLLVERGFCEGGCGTGIKNSRSPNSPRKNYERMFKRSEIFLRRGGVRADAELE